MTDKQEHEYHTEVSISPMMNGLIDIRCRSFAKRLTDRNYITLTYKSSSWERILERAMLDTLREFSANNEGHSFIRMSGRRIVINVNRLKSECPEAKIPDWLEGDITPSYDFSTDIEGGIFTTKRYNSLITLEIGREEYEMSKPKKIFLSHKGIDKPFVREYFSTLKMLGFDPWLDEDAMTAGVPLDRSILSGIEDSIASVFFITPQYVDENYLADEINYSIAQIRNRKGFKVIALQITDSKGKEGVVPKLLTPYVYKPIRKQEQLKGLREIIRALPASIKIDFDID